MECLCIVCVGVSVRACTQLINTSAGINTYKPPDSVLGIDLSLFLCALPLSPPFSNVLMMHTLRTQAHLTLCMGGTSCRTLSVCVFVFFVRVCGGWVSGGWAVMGVLCTLLITRITLGSQNKRSNSRRPYWALDELLHLLLFFFFLQPRFYLKG